MVAIELGDVTHVGDVSAGLVGTGRHGESPIAMRAGFCVTPNAPSKNPRLAPGVLNAIRVKID
jgi:hypothetical protein